MTIIADTLERPVPMYQMGSGENHVGYHIVAHLALHTWFAHRNRPVPRFLVLDQLSQAHFSPDVDSLPEIPRETLDEDRRAVKRLFDLIFGVTDSLEGAFQVIVTDHADFKDDNRFQSSVVQRWRGGEKLIPSDWPMKN